MKENEKGKRGNVTLIGMPASGKSTLGRLLAEALDYEFVDVDRIIEAEEKRLLREIIADEGDDGFMEIENRINAGLKLDGCVIAPGGSVIYGSEAMDHLKEISTVVYLKLSLKEMERRIGNPVERGVVLKNGMTLKKLYDERTPYYERYADVTLDESGKTLEESAMLLADIIKNFTKEK